MNMKYRILQGLLVCLCVPAVTEVVYPQEKQPAGGTVVFQREIQGPVMTKAPLPGDDTFYFVASEMTFDGKLVKGSPYSAQAVTETTQILGDGNRIMNKSMASIYRDSEGRTRREQTLRAIGPFATASEPPQSIVINDPISGVSYMLDERSHTARKMSTRRFEYKVAGPAESKAAATADAQVATASRRVEAASDVFVAVAPPMAGEGAGFRMEYHNSEDRKAKTEALGKQNVEGVEAEGTRTTLTIPAGEIGNERAIEVVSERWYSPQLQTVVMTRHSDPRFGETVYRLTNIDRSEPPANLFEVPADYTLKSSAGVGTGVGVGGGVGAGAGTGFGWISGDSERKAISGGVLNSKAISLPKPEYPAIARQANASGSVTVQISVDEDGNVISAKAVSGHPLLQSAAVDAARQAKFPPTKLDGKAVKIQGTVVYTFAAESNP